MVSMVLYLVCSVNEKLCRSSVLDKNKIDDLLLSYRDPSKIELAIKRTQDYVNLVLDLCRPSAGFLLCVGYSSDSSVEILYIMLRNWRTMHELMSCLYTRSS